MLSQRKKRCWQILPQLDTEWGHLRPFFLPYTLIIMQVSELYIGQVICRTDFKDEAKVFEIDHVDAVVGLNFAPDDDPDYIYFEELDAWMPLLTEEEEGLLEKIYKEQARKDREEPGWRDGPYQ